MKSGALHQFRHKLQVNEPTYGLWVTLEAAAIAEIATGLRFDWIGIDAANGTLDWQQVHEHVRATARSETVCLVRLPEATSRLVQRTLQLGAEGVLIPSPETPATLQALIDHVRESKLAAGHSATRANALVALMMDAGCRPEELRELIKVGIELFFFETCAGDETQFGVPIDRLVSEIRKAGKHAGIVAASDEDLPIYLARQFRVLGVGSDAGIISKGIQGTINALKQSGRI